jgi:hypothetical protein
LAVDAHRALVIWSRADRGEILVFICICDRVGGTCIRKIDDLAGEQLDLDERVLQPFNERRNWNFVSMTNEDI